MPETLSDEETRERDRRTNRALLIAGAGIALVVAVVALFAWMNDRREDAERVDGYYCTLSGIGPYDRAPETGKMCIELTD